MATEHTVTIIDDLTGEEADRTVVFGFGGRWFELDLAEANAVCVEGILRDWVDRGRDVTSDKPAARTAESRLRSAEVRAWALGQGWDLAPRGRIPLAALEAYASR